MDARSALEQMGGEWELRRIVSLFVDRVYADSMIGFFFRNVSREHIKEREFEFAARHLGGDVEYRGRPIRAAHAIHPIMGGQFMRRLEILRQTLESERVPPEVVSAWLAHNEKLRPLITRDGAGECTARDAEGHLEELGLEGKGP